MSDKYNNQEFVPMWVYKNGKHIGKNRWNIGGIPCSIEIDSSGRYSIVKDACEKIIIPEPKTYELNVFQLLFFYGISILFGVIIGVLLTRYWL